MPTAVNGGCSCYAMKLSFALRLRSGNKGLWNSVPSCTLRRLSEHSLVRLRLENMFVFRNSMKTSSPYRLHAMILVRSDRLFC